MSFVYGYNNKETQPDTDTIQFTDVPASAMTNKNIEWCRWDEDIQYLKEVWDVELSVEDEAILDQIVADNS